MGKATGKVIRISNDRYANNMKIIKCLHFFLLFHVDIVLKSFKQQYKK